METSFRFALGQLILTIGAVGPGSAVATMSASGSISGLLIQVVDLDPNDGIAATLTLGQVQGQPTSPWDTSHYAAVGAYATSDGYATIDVKNYYSIPINISISATAASSNISASATLTADDIFRFGNSRAATTYASGAGGTPLYTSALGLVYAIESMFTITPQTKITISTSGIGSVSTTLQGERSYTLFGVGIMDTTRANCYDCKRVQLSSFNGVLDGQETANRNFVATFSNNSNAAVYGGLDAWVQSEVFSLPAVPEPSIFETLIVGCLVLAGLKACRPPNRLLLR